ncbi:hypothetical protein MML48_5g00012012 [Holotrichia oblita]|uniref:Uncharacterized protein n=1 Tax=Holotrichia oblita TaxID=644536 RepID=A0ACB9T3H1_HOLOL|nr:hypothetical protein MML48_5g00012012 [Holotrichia oblita]
MKIVAPETHVIYLNIIESIPSEFQQDFGTSRVCELNVYQNEASEPVWSGDPCSPHQLTDIDLLHPEITVTWSPPTDPSRSRGKKLVVTAIGRGSVCKEKSQHTCMSIGHEPLFCVSQQLVCDGNRNCPKGATRSDEDDKICKGWPILLKEFKKSRMNDNILNLLKSQTTKSPIVHQLWQELTYNQRIDVSTIMPSTTHEIPSSNIESLSVALSHYGPWGYILLGMLICGTVLMFCGVWECFRKSKPSTPAESVQASPTTVLVIDPPEETDPPRYDDIDPPSYSDLFPNLKRNSAIEQVRNVPGSSSNELRQELGVDRLEVATFSNNNNQAQIASANFASDTNAVATENSVRENSDSISENKVEETNESITTTSDINNSNNVSTLSDT